MRVIDHQSYVHVSIRYNIIPDWMHVRRGGGVRPLIAPKMHPC